MVQYLSKSVKISPTGFTLVELIIVLIILGMLSVTAVPKLFSKSAFEDYTLRDQLISQLRLVQLQGINADPSDDATENACYWLVVKNSCFYHDNTQRSAGTCVSPSSSHCNSGSFNQYNTVSFSDGMLTERNYRFDLQGKLLINDSLIGDTFTININGDNNLSVEVETEGYIHE
ncbi:pilus assembly FimT family protein [Psychromonas sp. PT13]|uniref:pilus assembly FimT family protein n=1 Tax=Psychromonas sp. PT13 TaxID=3439547 RepID=UPI003EB97E8A